MDLFKRSLKKNVRAVCMCACVRWGVAGRGVIRGAFEGALAYNGIGVCMQ